MLPGNNDNITQRAKQLVDRPSLTIVKCFHRSEGDTATTRQLDPRKMAVVVILSR